MPIPEQRDPQVAREIIASWLQKQLPGAQDVRVSELSTPGGTGFSSETLMFDATWTQARREQTKGFVVRVEPKDYRLFLEAEFEPQYRVMRTLAERTDVPMPPMLWYEPDVSVLGAPFYVMGKVDGQAPSDSPPYHVAGWLTEVSPADRETLWWSGLETLAEIHKVDWRGLGFFELLDRPHRGKPGLDQQIAYYREYYEWAREGREIPVVDAAFEWLEANRPGEPEPLGLCWGDARIGNMLFRDLRCVAVLDWEMVTLGNPEQDLAWFLYLDRFHSEGNGNPRLPGLPDAGATVARYEKLTGHSVKNLHYYTVFAGMRFAVILLKIGSLLIGYGMSPAGRDPGVHTSVGRMLAQDMGVTVG